MSVREINSVFILDKINLESFKEDLKEELNKILEDATN